MRPRPPTLLAALAIAASLAGVATAAPALTSSSDPYPGVHHEVWTDAAIPARLHLVRIDLSSSELTLFATPEDERGARASGFAAAADAQIAINGDAFAIAGYVPLGLAVGGGAAWATTSDDATEGFLRFARVGERTAAAIVAPEQVVGAADLPAGTQGVVSGRPLLVRAGQSVGSFDCDDDVAMPCIRAPRTAVAMSSDGNTLWLVVVDGWQAGSLGLTAMELAVFLDGRGAHDALALDGGGASTLFIGGEGGVVSEPSDGAERVVANHLAVRHGALTPGQLVGFIRERDVFDAAASLAGVVVTLDDGRTDTTGADGLYNFPGVSPRLACATAALDGYRPETSCKQVVGGMVNYNSIALYPWSDFPDAGPGAPDAAAPDAALLVDGGPALDDGGNPVGGDGDGGGGGGGCGCRAGATSQTNRSGPAGVLMIALAVALALRPRRRPRDGGTGGNLPRAVL